MVTSLVNEVVCLSQSGTSNLWYILLQYLWEIMGISPEMDSSAKHSQAIWYYIVQKHWGGHGAWCSGSYSFAAESGTVAWSDCDNLWHVVLTDIPMQVSTILIYILSYLRKLDEPIMNTCLLRQIRRHRVHCAGEGRLRPAAASFNGCFRGPALSCFIWTSMDVQFLGNRSCDFLCTSSSCQIMSDLQRSATSPNALVWHWFIAFQCVSRDQWRPGRARPPTRGSESRNQHTSWTSSWWCRQGWQDHHDWIAEPGAFGAR